MCVLGRLFVFFLLLVTQGRLVPSITLEGFSLGSLLAVVAGNLSACPIFLLEFDTPETKNKAGSLSSTTSWLDANVRRSPYTRVDALCVSLSECRSLY